MALVKVVCQCVGGWALKFQNPILFLASFFCFILVNKM